MNKKTKTQTQPTPSTMTMVTVILRLILASFLLGLGVLFFIGVGIDIYGFAFPAHSIVLGDFVMRLWHGLSFIMLYLTLGFMVIILAVGLLGANRRLFPQQQKQKG